VLSLDKGHDTEILLGTLFFELHPEVSPDGRWLAYTSDESGRREIYVQPFPALGGKWQVSTEGGAEPVWNPNGGELFYRDGDKLMSVPVTTAPEFTAGKPVLLFEGHYEVDPFSNDARNYDVSPDGQHFVMIKAEGDSRGTTEIVVVLNWFEELKRLVPTN